MLTVEKIDTLQGFQALQPVWDELLESSQTRNIFLTYKWFHVWWSTFSDHNELYVLTVRRDQKIIGIAPLMLLCDSGKKTLQFIAANYSDLADFIIAEDHESVIDEIVTYLDGHRREWNSINLSQIAEQSRTARILTSRVAEADFRYLTDATDTCASHVYQGKEEERPDFSVKKSKTLRNQINFFRKSGGLSLNIIENIDDTLRLLPTFFHYHITRWNNTTTPSKFVKPENRQFYVNLLKAFHPTDNIRFLALMNGSIPIAFFFAFHLDKVLYLYTPSYNVYHTKRSPGIILNNLLMESFIRQGYKEIDFLRGDEAYKRRFCNLIRTNIQLKIYKNRTGYYRDWIPRRLKQVSLVRKLISNEKMKSLKDKVKSYYDSHGLAKLLTAILMKVFRLVWDYKVLLIFVFERHYSPWRIKADIDIEIKKLTSDDIDTICSYLGCPPNSTKYGVIQERFENGGVCFVAVHKGTIACTFWALARKDHFREIGKSYFVKENEMILSDALTSPLFRGQKVFQELLSEMITYYSDRNIKLYGSCFTYNRISLKGLKNIGFTVEKKLRYLRVLGIRLI